MAKDHAGCFVTEKTRDEKEQDFFNELLLLFFSRSAFSTMDVCMRAMCVDALQQFV